MGDGPTAADLPDPPTAFADPEAVWERSPAELFHTTKFGRLEKLMPPWRNQLSDDQIWQVAMFAWSLHVTGRDLTVGADLYAVGCAECHGETGAGDGPNADSSELSGDLPDFGQLDYAIDRSQKQWLDGWMAAHADVGAEWTLAEQHQTLEYVRSFAYVPPWESPFRAGTGTIEGVVRQGTAGGADLRSTTIRLEAFADFEPVAVFTTTAEIDGSFQFGELALDSSIVYLASASNAGVRYTSPIITLNPDEPAASTVVTVYETTDDPTGVRMDRSHWILDSQPGALVVGQIVTFGSTADRTYIGQEVEGIDQPATVSISVPEGAQEIIFENGVLGERFQRVGSRIYDTTPLVPGESTKQLIVRYAVPYSGNRLTVEQEFVYPVSQMNVLVADLPGLQVDVSGLTGMGAQDFQGRAYQIWEGADLAPQTVAVQLTGLLQRGDVDPRAAPDAAGGAELPTGASAVVPLLESWIIWFMGGMVVVILAGVVGWTWSQGRIQTAEPDKDLERQRADLLQRIAHLDDLHMVGEIDDEAWRTQRARLKARLLEISTRLVDVPVQSQ